MNAMFLKFIVIILFSFGRNFLDFSYIYIRAYIARYVRNLLVISFSFSHVRIRALHGPEI